MNDQAIQDYLKNIYEIECRQVKVTTNELAARLNISAASVSGMLKKLARMKLIDYIPYHGVKLTSAGKKMALSILRQHRLIELFLARTLGIPWDRVHQEAEYLEHVISPELENRIDSYLGHPKFDPHGAPIPQRDGSVKEHESLPLNTLTRGQRARIAEVSDRDPGLLRYLEKKGVFPGSRIEILDKDPYESTMRIKVENTVQFIGTEAAGQVYVVDLV